MGVNEIVLNVFKVILGWECFDFDLLWIVFFIKILVNKWFKWWCERFCDRSGKCKGWVYVCINWVIFVRLVFDLFCFLLIYMCIIFLCIEL